MHNHERNYNINDGLDFGDSESDSTVDPWLELAEEWKGKEPPLLDPGLNSGGILKSELQRKNWKKIFSAIETENGGTIEQFFKEKLNSIYDDPDNHSLLIYPENYLFNLQSLKNKEKILTANWYGCTGEQRDVVFYFYMHEVIAVLLLWEQNKNNAEFVKLYFPILKYITKTASSRYQWVSAFTWSPVKTDWEKEMENVPPFRSKYER